MVNTAYEKKTFDEDDRNGYNATTLQLHKSYSVQNITIAGKKEFTFGRST